MDYLEGAALAAIHAWKADIGRETPMTDEEAKLFIAGYKRGALSFYSEEEHFRLTSRVEPMLSSFDNSIFGYRCGECEEFWKIYHTNESHTVDCSHHGKTEFADN